MNIELLRTRDFKKYTGTVVAVKKGQGLHCTLYSYPTELESTRSHELWRKYYSCMKMMKQKKPTKPSAVSLHGWVLCCFHLHGTQGTLLGEPRFAARNHPIGSYLIKASIDQCVDYFLNVAYVNRNVSFRRNSCSRKTHWR